MPTNKNQISVYIYDKIKNAPGMAAITDRIVPEVIDTSSASYPYIVYSVKNNTPTNTKNSVSKLDTVDIIVTIVSKSYSELSTMSDIIRTALDYTTDESEGIQKVFFQTENFLYDDDLEPEGAFVLTQEYLARIEKPLTSSDTIMVFDTRITNLNSTNENSLLIPVYGSASDFTIDWGDGTTQAISGSGDITHTYSTPGIYKVKMSGEKFCVRYNDQLNVGITYGESDSIKLLTIENWGIFDFLGNACFAGCINMDITATDTPTITSTSAGNSMFRWCLNLVFNESINNWDISLNTNFYSTFAYCLKFNHPLDNWDVSSATSMGSMFFRATSFNQDLNSWDVSNVNSFTYCFGSAHSFNGKIGNWNLRTTGSANIDCTGMFSDTYTFNQYIGDWNTEKVFKMTQMFNAAYSFDQNINSWDTSNVTNMYRMFYNAEAYDQLMDDWDISNVTNFIDFMKSASRGLSTANYDALLISWSAQDVSLNESINFGPSQYTAGGAAEAARTNLITNKGWTITDGGAA